MQLYPLYTVSLVLTTALHNLSNMFMFEAIYLAPQYTFVNFIVVVTMVTAQIPLS